MNSRNSESVDQSKKQKAESRNNSILPTAESSADSSNVEETTKKTGVRQFSGTTFCWRISFRKAAKGCRTQRRKGTLDISEILLRLGVSILALLCLGAANARACGPWFPNNLLDSGDRAVLTAPVLRFGEELERMQLVQTHWRAVLSTNDHPQETADAEIADLTAALKKARTLQPEIERICEAHQAERNKLQQFVSEVERWKTGNDSDNDTDQQHPTRNEPPKFPDIKFVAGLPQEFVDYFDGACAWRREQRAKAQAAWERLLERPAAERKYKSTWAAFMLGKLLMEDEPEQAREYFQQVRNLAKRGFADSIGLATASLGLEARVNLDQKNFEKAIELYLEQLAAGDYSAIPSLRITAYAALDDNEPDGQRLISLAKNPRTQKVLTAYLASQDNEWQLNHATETDTTDSFTVRWLKSVEAADVSDLESAEKLALAAYQDGSFMEAKRWIKRAPGSPLTQWLQAKLLLRDGKISQAAALLANVALSFPLKERDTNAPKLCADNLESPFADSAGAQVRGELGVLQLTRHQYVEALDSLLRSDFWQDAAYVAERVLTLDELKRYVDKNWPEPKGESNDPAMEPNSRALSVLRPAQNIRYLLARRLTRSQRGFQAREYFPPEWQPKFDELATALTDGWNEALPNEQRARALFTSATIARTNGMELCGTELAPDWFVHGGNFENGVTADGRTNDSFKILAATEDELRRAFAHKADPEVRFHYRYQAAFLGWEAAKLLPNHSDETARILCIAGSWIKDRDPDTADLFYKTLVKRCRKTAIGMEADRIRWFPELDGNGSVIRRTRAAEQIDTTETATESEPRDEPEIRKAEAVDEFETTNGESENEIRETGFEYVVKAGDSLLSIANNYASRCVAVRVKQIFDANPSVQVDRLRVGQKLFIPMPPD